MNSLKTKKWWVVYYIAIFVTNIVHEIFNSGGISFYFVHTLGMSVKTQALLLSIYAPVSAIMLIVCGIIVDRYPGRKEGRRIPFIRVFGVVEGLVFVLIFSLPIPGQTAFGAVCYFLGLFMFGCAYNFECDANFAIPSEEVTDKVKRSKIYVKTGIISGIALLLQSTVFMYLQVEDGQDATLFRILMVIVGVIVAIVTLWESYHLPHEFRQDEMVIKESNVIKSFLECFKNRVFIIGECYLTSVVISTSILMFGIFYYFSEVKAMRIEDLIVIPIAAAVIFFAYNYLEKKVKRKYMYAFFSFASCLGFFITFLCGENIYAGIPLILTGGCLLIIQYIFNNFIILDAVDIDAKKSGIRKEAQYLAIDYVLDTVGTVGKSLFLFIIMYYGYVEGSSGGAQPESAKTGILIGCFLMPAILLFIGTIAILFCPETVHDKENNK